MGNLIFSGSWHVEKIFFVEKHSRFVKKMRIKKATSKDVA
jgi:hypothetical protein